MDHIPLLSLTTFLPLLGVLLILLFGGNDEHGARTARYTALWTSLLTFAVSIFIWTGYVPGTASFQFEEKHGWLQGINISYHLGVDGVSMLFVMLSTFLTPICVLASWDAIKKRVREYMIAFLVLETMMIGMFCALDMLVFYFFFEGVLIPMFLIIGVWGGPRRVYSAFKFFLFTLTGSVLMLLAIIAMYFVAGTTDMPVLMKTAFAPEIQYWMWLGFFAAFAVKVPMWPVHTWLPDAHVEAPTAGSVILAGVLLKMGGYGFYRISLPMLPDASHFFGPFILTLSGIAIVYTSLTALVQQDMKKLIAYSSVAHMGVVTIGLFIVNTQAVEGSIIQMLSHGVVSAALFLCVGVVYDRMHTRDIDRYGGLATIMPRYALVFMVFMLASVGLPGTSGFVGEFLTIVGAFRTNTWAAAAAASGLILGAAYMLYLYRRVVFGVVNPGLHLGELFDLTPREIAIFAPMIAVVFWLGIYPSSFLGIIEAPVDSIVANYQQHLAASLSFKTAETSP
jgi:NADH-quinone oxidoreductase subunit M